MLFSTFNEGVDNGTNSLRASKNLAAAIDVELERSLPKLPPRFSCWRSKLLSKTAGILGAAWEACVVGIVTDLLEIAH